MEAGREGWRQGGPALPAPSRAAVVLKPGGGSPGGGSPAPSPKGSCTPPGARAGGNRGKNRKFFAQKMGSNWERLPREVGDAPALGSIPSPRLELDIFDF